MTGFSKKDINKVSLREELKQAKPKRQPINFSLYISLVAMLGVIVGLCMFIKIQNFSVTIKFPPMVVAFAVAVMGLSALYVVFKEVRR